MASIAVRLTTLLLFAGALAAQPPPRPKGLETADPEVAARLEDTWRTVVERPDDAARWLDLGRAYHAHTLTEPARECYRRATELAPTEPKAWYLLGHAEAELGEVASAVQRLERVVALAPGYAPAHWRRGRWLLELGRVDEAEAAFRRSTEVDQNDAAGWVGLARTLLERGEAGEAIGLLQRVLAADPANGVAGQLLGTALLQVGDTAAARHALGLATGMGAYFPDPWHEEMLLSAAGVGNRLRLLSARLERGEAARVIPELRRLADDHPHEIGVLGKLAEAYLRLGDPDSALPPLRTALEADPDDFSTLLLLAQAEKLRGQLEAALGWADRAVAANSRMWQSRFEKASILWRAGRLDACLETLEAALGLGAHQNPNAWLMKGDVLLRTGDWNGAAETFDQATRRFPFLGQAFVGLAVARVEQGRPREAREALDAARRLQPEDETMAAVAARLQELEAQTAAPAEGGG